MHTASGTHRCLTWPCCDGEDADVRRTSTGMVLLAAVTS